MGYYTLLADDNSPLSGDVNLRKEFRAHVVYNVLLNGGLTFSDNQVVSSRNLRFLARRDGVIRKMFERGMFSVALREGFNQKGVESLGSLHQAFVNEGKLRGDLAQDGDIDELKFIEDNAKTITWTFDDVHRQFTESVEKMVLSEFRDRLSDNQLDELSNLIAEEKDRDRGGLGRAFIQNADRLPLQMERCGFMTASEARPLLVECSDAVYLSNLPKTIGLNPIYAQEHKESFQRCRGFEYGFETAGKPRALQDRLSWDHYLEGLHQLDIDDIDFIHNRSEYRDFQQLSQSDNVLKEFDSLQIVFAELNMIIEDRIIQRFPWLARRSPKPAPRQIEVKYGTRVLKGGKVIASDLIALSIAYSEIALPFVPFQNLFSNLVLDAVKSKFIPERPHVDAARRHSEMAELRKYLERKGLAEKIQFNEEYSTSSSFDKEIIVD